MTVALNHAGRQTPLREGLPARVLDASRRYGELELRQRRLLAALAAHDGEVPTDTLAAAVQVPTRAVFGMMVRLTEVGMAVQTPHGWALAASIRSLAQADLRSSVHISLILPVPDLLIPVCANPLERRIFRALVLLFPNCAVMANLRLSEVVDPVLAQPYLDSASLKFLAHPAAELDAVIYSGCSLLPVLAVEADVPQHDHPPQSGRDGLKNTICRLAGLPLMRVRIDAHVSDDVLMHRLRRALHQVAKSPRPGQRGHAELAEALARLT
ncbi:DUF2726 domain-containing protein [Deinococcus sp.]|uniref:DUF2726 domain-containing protein n=1 Tax=Deinococcus sp. TaxID=47478 RepID=UPI0025BEAF81|nr:DUF2726 domain-containing protein [Deinococcus sp.]